MPRWNKVKNPPISDWALFRKWCDIQRSWHKVTRYKIREYNGDIYVKYKNDLGNFERFWLKTWPENCVIIPTKTFYKPEFVSDPFARKYSIGEYVWARDMEGHPDLRQWFIDTFGSEWECIDKVYIDEKNWVDELGDETINIFQTVFVFKFKTKSDAVKYKLIYGCE